MKNEDHNQKALTPLHGTKIPIPNPEWVGFQNLIWHDDPLLFAMGSAAEPYLGFAGGQTGEVGFAFFLVPFTVAGIDAYMTGDLTLSAAIGLAGGDVYYSEDLAIFHRVPLVDIPEADRVHLPLTGKPSLDLMERMPIFSPMRCALQNYPSRSGKLEDIRHEIDVKGFTGNRN
jgi:hypothetical protein